MEQYFATLPPDKIVAELQARVDEYYKYVDSSGLRSKWLRNYKHYYGVGTNGQNSGQITKAGDQGELTQIKVNDYRNLIQHLLVMTTQSRPALQCKAANTDTKSLRQAVIGNSLLEYYLRERGVESSFGEATEIGLVLTEGAIMLEWDSAIGDPIRPNPETEELIRTGDIKIHILTPMDIVRDPYLTHSKHQWYIVRVPVNRWDLISKFPEHRDTIIGKDVDRGAKYLDDKPSTHNLSDQVYLYIFLHDKTTSVRDGKLVLFIADKCLQEGALPYDEMPVYPIRSSKWIGSGFGYSQADDLVGMQEIQDALDSTIVSNQITFGCQNIVGPKGVGINRTDLGTGFNYFELPPEHVDKLKALQLTHTAPEIFEYRKEISHRMETQSGVNSVARGNPEASLKSGSALALVQAQAIQFNSGLEKAYNRLLEDVGTGIIKILQRYADSPRVVKITGRVNGKYLKDFKFSKDDISLISGVQVEAVNPVSKTMGGRLEMVKDLIQGQWVKNAKQYITFVTTGSTEALIQDDEADQQAILAENEELSQGRPISVILTENHEEHVKSHSSLIASPEAKKDGQLVQLVLDHIQKHMDTWQMLSAQNPSLLLATNQKVLPVPQPLGPGAPAPNGPPLGPGTNGVPPPGGGPKPMGIPSEIMSADNPTTQRAAKVSMPNQPKNPMTGERINPQA